MSKEVIFISDLHLSLEKPEITRRFLNFLSSRAPKAQSLYILGDLFDSWIGDDDYTPPTKAIRTALKKLTDSGTRIFFQPGNRDFLIGERFCNETGIQMLEDYAVIDLDNQRILLTHGDLLCTDDVAYQQFRALSRSPEWRHKVLAKPLFLRLLAARWYRLRSHFHKRKKTLEIMDVNPQTVVSVMKDHNADRLIHGHTHRPAFHDFTADGKSYRRIVLADWKKNRIQILCYGNNDFTVETI